ncbi:hypothetical protein [Nocardioides sp. InS609-2]|uniref:hypothetical protein n=1 Tax=Nocardioides sp. InS609-2 TaxID=2760705 RepID=UPI0020BEFA7D|nr:hypothetical protein [Nocardioides sp. InS609-2]
MEAEVSHQDLTILYTVVGHVVVCAGNLESRLKRTIAVVDGVPYGVDDTLHAEGWGGLEKQMTRRFDRPRATGLRETFEAHDFPKLLEFRNSVIHGAINVSSAPNLWISRHKKGVAGRTLLGTWEQALDLASEMDRLNVALHDWCKATEDMDEAR